MFPTIKQSVDHTQDWANGKTHDIKKNEACLLPKRILTLFIIFVIVKIFQLHEKAIDWLFFHLGVVFMATFALEAFLAIPQNLGNL